jgi:hypothetical protein
MPNEYAVNHVVNGLHGGRDNGRNRILHQQLANAARTKQIGRFFIYVWCGIRPARRFIGLFQSKYAPALYVPVLIDDVEEEKSLHTHL